MIEWHVFYPPCKLNLIAHILLLFCLFI